MPQSHPLVSIIIVSWNAVELLKQCLPSVVDASYPNFEVILADNASTDESVTWTKQHLPSVRIVQHPENWAFCKGNNEAIPHAKGKYIVLLNNDVEVPPHWLQPLVDRMEANPDVAAIQPKLLQYDQRSLFEYAGASGGHLDSVGYPFTRGRLFFDMETDEGQYNDATDVFWATGAAMMIRRSVLDEVGLLDEQFFMHMEEIDLCWRMQRAGYRIMVEPASEVYHIGGASLPQGNARKTYFNFRNSLLMLYKNLPPHIWRKRFLARMLLDGIAMYRSLFLLRPADAGAIMRAYRDAHVLSKTYRSSRPTKKEKVVLPSFKGSIVLEYYLKQKLRFSDLDGTKFWN